MVSIEIIKGVLESGNSVELPAIGYSMFPTLQPGDRVIVESIKQADLPKPGQIVVYLENNVFIMHRLVEIINEGHDDPVFITRGDSQTSDDKVWQKQQLSGIATFYKRGTKMRTIKDFHMPKWQNYFNRSLLWIYRLIYG